MQTTKENKDQLIKKVKRLEKRLKNLEMVEHRCRIAEGALKKNKDDLEAQTWGLKKTNEAIKLLYRELETKNRELQKLDDLKSSFISTVSHELRTPLSIVKEGISLVLEQIPGPINEKQKNLLSISKGNIDRLARMINELLDISRIESGKLELKKGLVNMPNLIKGVIASFQQKADEKGVKLKLSIPNNEIDVYIDADKIIEVLTNLIGNSLKFTEKGYIELSISEKEEIECSIKDTGRGIPKDALHKVFDKFQQFGRVPGAGEKGTGLGLSIAKGIVEMHKGNIWIDSELGKGTTFTFTLPKYTPEDLFREYVSNKVKEAEQNGVKMSLIVISIAGFNKITHRFSKNKINTILKDLEEILNRKLKRAGDIVLKDTGEIIVHMVDCDKTCAISIKNKLKQALQDYLKQQKLIGKIKLRFGCVTYPDKIISDNELIKKVKGANK